MELIKKSTTLPDGRIVTIETGVMAKQADGAVLLTCGETMLLATVVAKRDINLETDFLPLSVDYMEKFAGAGRFPGGFFKRDGRMGEGEILTSRLIDRAIRPLFPDDYHADTQLMVQMISSDSMDQPDAYGCLVASAALLVSDIPFAEPVSEVRVARIDGKFVINPTFEQMEICDIELMVAATNDSVNMVEGEMKEVSEEVMLEAIKVAHDAIRSLNNLQLELAAAAAKPTREYDKLELNEDMYNDLFALVAPTIDEVSRGSMPKQDRSDKMSEAKKAAKEALMAKYEDVEYFDVRFATYFKSIQKTVVRDIVVKEKLRLDGRKPDEIRPIWSQTGILPRSHGSSLFTRGETQALCTTTMGTKFDEQTIDTATFHGSKRFMLQYNFPAFSTGEVKPNRGPARREIGHGNLAERALKPVVPTDTPYTIRVSSTILESNGSSSMASVCGGCLSMMDAGVQITGAVSGIAMGLVTTQDGFAVLSDILGDEDFLGDMDFKVAGTAKGLTACQMDIKIRGLSYEILEAALEQSKAGRLHILNEMLKELDAPRPEVSRYAPRFFSMDVPHDMFGTVIGPGGKIIQEIQKITGAQINLEEGPGNVGTATISATNADAVEAAVLKIRQLILIPEVGEVYKAKVKSIQEYGAFVEFLPGKEGLLHISEISWERLPSMEGVFEVGDELEIKLVGVDERSGKFRLSHKVLLPMPEGHVEREERPRGDRPRGDRPQGDRPRGDRPQGDRPRGDRDRGPRR
ncbi:MAG: polyribonucleotide nucleotidyltransferase [Bacteroidia bacterium]|nr:polyribonucleotide nucleotidyltransferase [Bacteroidia bacterium]